MHSLCLVLCPGKEAPRAVTPCAVSGRLPACSLRLYLRVWPALRRAVVLGGDGLLLHDVHVLLQRFLFRLRRVASVLCGRQCAEAGLRVLSDRVSVILHEKLGCTPLACSTARNSHNSLARVTGVHHAMQRVIRSGHGDVASVNLGDSFVTCPTHGNAPACNSHSHNSPASWPRIRRIRWAKGLHEDVVSVYLGETNFGVLLWGSLLLCSRRQEVCMKRRGQVATKASA